MKTLRISIFEDNAKYRESLEFAIYAAGEGLELSGSYSNTDRLLDRIKENNPDVVLMDINIPGINGISAAKEIKEKFPHIQVCMQTVFEEEDKVFASLCAGASGYILKSTPAEKILQAIWEVANGGAFFTPSIAKKVLSSFQQNSSTPEHINLSDREKEVLQLLVDGMSYKIIAHKIFLSYETVHSHVKKIYEKLHVNSKSEAVAKAIRNKLV